MFKRVRLAGILSGLVSMAFVVLLKYIYYGGLGENPLNIIICLKLGTLFCVSKYFINITLIGILEYLGLNFPLEELLFYLGWEDLLKFSFIDLLEIFGLKKQKIGMGGLTKPDNTNFYIPKPDNVLSCKTTNEEEALSINKDSSSHPNQWVDVVSEQDKLFFPYIVPRGVQKRKRS